MADDDLSPGVRPATREQREFYHALTGDELPPGTTARGAVAAIVAARQEMRGLDPRPRKRRPVLRPSERQAHYFLWLTGRPLPEGATRMEASELIDRELKRRFEAGEPMGGEDLRELDEDLQDQHKETEMKSEDKPAKPVLPHQAECYRRLTGQELPPGMSAREAARAIRKAIKKLDAPAETPVADRAKTLPKGSSTLGAPTSRSAEGTPHVREIVPRRLYAVDSEHFQARHSTEATVVVVMGPPLQLEHRSDRPVLTWEAADNVDQRVLEGVVRFVSSSMQGSEQRVLLVGNDDAVDTVAACVLREYTSCSPMTAIGVIRKAGANRLANPDLVATIMSYKLT